VTCLTYFIKPFAIFNSRHVLIKNEPKWMFTKQSCFVQRRGEWSNDGMVTSGETEVLYSNSNEFKRTRENEILIILTQQCSLWEHILNRS